MTLVRAVHDFQGSDPEELSFQTGDIIHVLGAVYKEWYKGTIGNRTGIFPINYVEVVDDTPNLSDAARSEENDNECKICFEEGTADHCLVPCGHTGLCETCAKAVRVCPFCKKDINQAIKLYKV